MSIKLFNFTVNTVASLRCRNRKHTHTHYRQDKHTPLLHVHPNTQPSDRRVSGTHPPQGTCLSDSTLYKASTQISHSSVRARRCEEGGRGGGRVVPFGGRGGAVTPHPRQCTNTPSLLSQSIHGGTGGGTMGAVPSSLSFPLHLIQPQPPDDTVQLVAPHSLPYSSPPFFTYTFLPNSFGTHKKKKKK